MPYKMQRFQQKHCHQYTILSVVFLSEKKFYDLSRQCGYQNSVHLPTRWKLTQSYHQLIFHCLNHRPRYAAGDMDLPVPVWSSRIPECDNCAGW